MIIYYTLFSLIKFFNLTLSHFFNSFFFRINFFKKKIIEDFFLITLNLFTTINILFFHENMVLPNIGVCFYWKALTTYLFLFYLFIAFFKNVHLFVQKTILVLPITTLVLLNKEMSFSYLFVETATLLSFSFFLKKNSFSRKKGIFFFLLNNFLATNLIFLAIFSYFYIYSTSNFLFVKKILHETFFFDAVFLTILFTKLGNFGNKSILSGVYSSLGKKNFFFYSTFSFLNLFLVFLFFFFKVESLFFFKYFLLLALPQVFFLKKMSEFYVISTTLFIAYLFFLKC